MGDPILDDSIGVQGGQHRKKMILPIIAFLSALSPCYLGMLILLIALIFSSAFEPPPGHSSVLMSPNAGYLYALALPMFLLVPLGFILGGILVIRDRRRGYGPGNPLAWAAVVISGMCLFSSCVTTFLPVLFAIQR